MPSDVFILQTDASRRGIGAILRVTREEVEPIAFYLRKLLERERRYGATELEGLAVVDAVDHIRVYLATILYSGD